VTRDWYRHHRRLVVGGAAVGALLLSAALLLAPLLAAVLGVAGGWAAVIVLAVADRMETVEKWGGRGLGSLSWLGSRTERVALAAEIQGLINGARKDLQAELPDVMPSPARVRFVRTEVEVAALREGEVVISLKNPRKRAENTARATMAYVSTAMIRPARPYVAPSVIAGVDYSVTKKILRQADVHALDYFLNEVWGPELEGRADLRDACHEVERVEAHGLLTHVLLVEYLELGRKRWGGYPSEAERSETREFLSYVANVADKDPEDYPPLEFLRRSLRVGVVLVGEKGRAEQEGARPYVKATLHKIGLGCDSVYLLARGARCPLVAEVLAQVENDGRVRVVDLADYQVEMDGRLVPAVCARLTVEQRGGRR
jgi:hypothetical protein